ncbi:type IV secretion system DNA-binding domain-containing protein [Candidatus Tisiphia endosymbiont of Ditula angustiorana]|uniref:type IV secretion system DNA-binding domain-containing protein n=1 Tax=Candidatus Tisiphia endosymbiont of Ditula angustiorana TaxID=3066272 RepID=UPI0039778F27
MSYYYFKSDIYNTILHHCLVSKEAYYNPDRGDIIFNPLDARSHSWDFWTDTSFNNS